MELAKIIKDKTCYIVSNELKKAILTYIKENKLLLDIHFFSLNDLITKVYYDYNYKAIYLIEKRFNVSFNNAKMLIDNLKYLMYSSDYNNDKIRSLKEVKEALDEEHLLTYNKFFLDYLRKYNIISDLPLDNEFFYRINELLDNKIQFINQDIKSEIQVLQFTNSEEEINYLANEISALISSGIKEDKIYILNYQESYYAYLDKIFTLYNLPYSINNPTSLYDIPYIKHLYNDYQNKIIDSTTGNLELNQIFDDLVKSTNFIEDEAERTKFLLDLLKSSSYNKESYENIINISDYRTYYLDDNYYFFIGLNNRVFPNYLKDEDYLDDKSKTKLGYLPSYKLNRLKKEYAINKLSSKSHLVISYRDSDYFNSYLKSDLIDLIKAKTVKLDNTNVYSKSYDLLKFSRELDDYYKFDQKSASLIDLLNKLDKSIYKSYSNKYTKIDNNLYINKVLNNKLSISYTSFQRFNECKYKYYLESILKERQDSFETYLGSLLHHVLEKIYDNDFNFEKEVASYNSEYQLSDKERILLEYLLKEFANKIEIIQEQYHRGNYKNILKEKHLSLKLKTKLSIDINGTIDRLMLDENGHAYIVDYKTGDNKLTLEYLEYGLKAQLPFYFYLLSKSREFANVFLVGCYLQIINFKIKSYKENNKDLLLEGLTYSEESLIKEIDNYYNDDSFIKGIKPNSKGLGTYAKLFDSHDFELIIDTMDKNIKAMIKGVEEADFEIDPKILKNKETTCNFCNYKDICYHSFKDYKDLRKELDNGMDE